MSPERFGELLAILRNTPYRSDKRAVIREVAGHHLIYVRQLAALADELTYADDKDIMLEAIDALGKSAWEGGFERLDELTLDPDPEVAQVAEDALEEWTWLGQILDEYDDSDLDLDWSEDD